MPDMGDLSEIRGAVLAQRVPVMLDAADVALALDISEAAVRNRFDDWSVCGDRYMVRAAEVRSALLAMKPAEPVLVAARACRSCRGPLPIGARRSQRFCSKRCSEMTLTARAALPQNSPPEKSSVSAPIDGTPIGVFDQGMGGSTSAARVAYLGPKNAHSASRGENRA
jgi:hypothetical protein